MRYLFATFVVLFMFKPALAQEKFPGLGLDLLLPPGAEKL